MLFDRILSASKRVANYIGPTPVFTSGTVDKLTGRNVFFKAENLQKTGSFKIRGALNAVSIDCCIERDREYGGVYQSNKL